ncbi:type II toxin-antitoxin system RelE/ParE family toxin [Mucilaginibacter terrae]|uniref:type II toxin-antitoxin system RelE/ParE family toxin n=1 Tax=Mucilaginibacter terrae TaxID=1955052 RepID=UPI003624B819
MGQVNIVVTESAFADLEEIESYISIDSPAIARKFISRIFDRIDQLQKYPESGKFVPEIPDPFIRELLFNKYRIIYQLKDKTVSVLRVVHGSRLLDLDM